MSEDAGAVRHAGAEAQRAAARLLAGGVVVAAAADGERLHAITATAFCSLSLEPPLVLLAVAREGQLLDVVRTAGHYGISVLRAEQHHVGHWAARRGRSVTTSSPPFDMVRGATGAPLVRGALAWFDCRLRDASEHGDHVVLVGQVVRAWADRGGDPLLYFRGSFHALGAALGRGPLGDAEVRGE